MIGCITCAIRAVDDSSSGNLKLGLDDLRVVPGDLNGR